MSSPSAVPLEDAIVDALRQLGIKAHYDKDQAEHPRVGFSVAQSKTGTILVSYYSLTGQSREKIVAFATLYLQDENINYKVMQKPTGNYVIQFAGPDAITWSNTLRRRVVELARFYNQEVQQDISRSDILSVLETVAGVLTDATRSIGAIMARVQSGEEEENLGDPVTWGSGK